MIDKILKNLKEIPGPQYVAAQGSMPNCPFCDAKIGRGEAGDLGGCEHFVGAWSYWYSDDEGLEYEAQGATHYMSFETQIGGEDLYFFNAAAMSA